MDKDEWSSGVDYELNFWRRWLETKGGQWPDDYNFRVNPQSVLQENIARFVPSDLKRPLELLDVGAGPMSFVGKTFQGVPIALTAVDALGEQYEKLPFPPGLPLVRTQACFSEELTDKFPLNSFDVVISRNALDHGYDPCKAILEMIAVCRPGGVVITLHAENEALREKWQGFHQWNFAVEGNRFLISNKTQTFDVAEQVGGAARFVHLTPKGAPMVHCVLQKT